MDTLNKNERVRMALLLKNWRHPSETNLYFQFIVTRKVTILIFRKITPEKRVKKLDKPFTPSTEVLQEG